MCETRWVERHTNMTDLLEMYQPILATLETLSTSTTSDNKTVSEAVGLRTFLMSDVCIAGLVISEHMLGYTKQLSIKLQGESKMSARLFRLCYSEGKKSADN